MIEKTALIKKIEDIMGVLSFPKEAVESLLADFEKLATYKTEYARFSEIVEEYEGTVDIDYKAALSVLQEAAEVTGICVYSLNMLHFLSLCPRLRERYAERGLPDGLFVDTMQDLRIKVYECKSVHGVWGTFVGFWFERYFNKIDRFFFKRLQLEPKVLEYDCTVDGKEYKKGAKVLNVHIPRTGTPLMHDEVIESYRQAVEFFGDYYGAEDRLIVCNSWLLSPMHDDILKPDSNMLLFAHDYTLAQVARNDKIAQLWLLFEHVVTEENIDDLPTKTSLQRAYVDLLKRGEKPQTAYGVFNYDEQLKKWCKN